MEDTIMIPETSGDFSEIDLNRLEQVTLNMPEVRFYFSGDREQSEENLNAYIGGELLELKSMSRFDESGDAICYNVLLDISASISETEFHQITDALSIFCKNVRQQDRMNCLTFGEEVKTLFSLSGEELTSGAAQEYLQAIQNADQKTLLFEAVRQMSEMTIKASDRDHVRHVALVITDGEDIAKGVATKEEARQILQENGIPVYGITLDSAKRETINAFGEFSRSTGGTLTILKQGEELSGLTAIQEELLSSYEAVFVADSNCVTNGIVNTSLEFINEGERRQSNVLQNRWIKDTENPVIIEASNESSTQIKVLFSEPVKGTDAAENFKLSIENSDDGITYIPAFASPGSDGNSVVLTFAEPLISGDYELFCENIHDTSMEQNPLDGSSGIAMTIAGTDSLSDSNEKTSGFFQTYDVIFALVAIALLIIGFCAYLSRLKKRKAIVTVEGKAVLPTNVETKHHIVVETEKNLQEKQVFFHVSGQKEELSIRIISSMIVGRAKTCELIFDDPALSRQHFSLELDQDNIKIRNLSQSSFTTVNGLRLGTDSYVLHKGDVIGAGQLKMTIRW